MDQQRKKKGIQSALTSAMLLGLAPVFGKDAINMGFSPIAVTAFRTTIAAVILLVLVALFRRKLLLIYPVGLAGCLLAGFFNGLGSILYYNALSRLDVGISHLLYSFYPLFIGVWMIIDRQPITRLTKVRLALTIPAVFLVVQAGKGAIDLVAAAMMLGSSILYALHLIINQRVLYEVPAQTVTVYTLLGMSATVMLGYLCFDRAIPAAGSVWTPLLILAGLTFMSRILLFMGVKRLGGMQTAMLGLSELLVALAVSQIWLGEHLSLTQWLGALLLIISLLLVSFDHFSPEKRHSNGWLAWLNPPQPSIPSDLPPMNFGGRRATRPAFGDFTQERYVPPLSAMAWAI